MKQSFVFGDRMAGNYSRQVKLSDGSIRKIDLHPVVMDGEPLVEVKVANAGKDSLVYLKPNGATYRDSLLVSVTPAPASQETRSAAGSR